MLIELSVANYRSIRDRQILSLVAGPGTEMRGPNVADAPGDLALLRVAAVFGPNASGKSTLFKALATLQQMVQWSAVAFQQGQLLPVVPFRLEAATEEQPTEFEIHFIAGDGVRYQYGVSATARQVHEEWLIAYPHGRAQRWFERTHASSANTAWKLGPNFLGSAAQRKVWQESTRDNALFLSTAVQLNNEQLQPAFQWLTQGLIVVAPGIAMNPMLSLELLRTEPGARRIMGLLHAADIDIDHLELKEEDAPPPPPGMARIEIRLPVPPGFPLQSAQNKFLRVMSWHKRKDDGEAVAFDFGEESDGTRKLFEYAGGLLQAIDRGATVCIDELDSSLHPRITRFLVEQFQPSNNPKNAQLVFSTHDVTLMDQDLLRRDQVWFIEKDAQGGSRLYPLLDYSPRKGEALERGYLKGRYGAVPLTGTLES
jgi:ABC-type branched-subunit amino acid transport system ATPase component